MERRAIPLVLVAGVAVLGFVAWRALRPPQAQAPAPGRSGKATVAIYDDGQPLADRWVVFHDAEGKVAATVRSGRDGKATSEVHEGAMVTVAYGSSIQRLVTVTGVQPGDEIVVGEHEDDEKESGNSVSMATIHLPAPHPSAARYAVTMGVGKTDVADVTAPLRMPILRRFLVEDRRFPVLGLAFDKGGEPTAFTFALPELRETDGGDSEVRLPAWSTDWREHRVVLAHAPAGLTRATGELAIVSGEDRFPHAAHVDKSGPAETTLRFLVPRPLGESAIVRVTLADATSRDKVMLVRRAKAQPPEVRIDLQEAIPPRVSDAKVERSPDLARPRVRWSTSGRGKKADATVMQLSWPETREHVWTIIAPPTTQPGFEVPALPEALAEWRPDARAIGAAVALVEASEYASYDDVRKKGIHLVGEPPEDDEGAVATSTTGDPVF